MSNRRCEHVEHVVWYAKQIAGIGIDRGEWVDERGAIVGGEDVRCSYVADAGESLCPKHKFIQAASSNSEAE